jgi:hypothetical protein
MFVCESCSFSCSKKSNYTTHINTKKHLQQHPQQLQQLQQQQHPQQLQHTKKHRIVKPARRTKELGLGLGVVATVSSTNRQYICETCSAVYKDRSGLWRHVKKCNSNSNQSQLVTATATDEKNAENKLTVYHGNKLKQKKTLSYDGKPSPDNPRTPTLLRRSGVLANADNRKMPEESMDALLDGNVCYSRRNDDRSFGGELNMSMLNMIYDLVKQNQEIKEMLLKQHELMLAQTNLPPQSIIQQQIIHNHTTNNHAHVNINLFLQEKCKYAMNMNEFVDNLTVQMCDVEMVGRLGFVEGISRIIINGLRSLDVYTRPIHCTDTKRETIYIRQRDEWTRDTDDKEQTKQAIARVANKNLNKIPEWKRLHPETDIFESNAYNMNMQIMVQSLGGIGGTSAEKTARNQEKIWKRIMPEVAVDKKSLLSLYGGT